MASNDRPDVPVQAPRVLTVVTVGGSGEALARTGASLAAQTDGRWEWLLVGGEPPAGGVSDERVRLLQGPSDGHPADLQRALTAATGRLLLVLAAGDDLADSTVELVDSYLPAGTWGYSDELQVFGPGRSPDLWEKPAWSPELVLSQPYPVRSAFLPVEALRAEGGFRSAAGTAAVYDAVLRCSIAVPPELVPHPLVLRRDRNLRIRFVEGRTSDVLGVVGDHAARLGIDVESVEEVRAQGIVVGQRVRRRLAGTPSVSLVVPTRGSTSTVRGRPRCHVVEMVRSVWTADRWPDLEVVVVYDAETPEEVLAELRDIVGEDLTLVPYDDWFHFSRKCNLGALAARGELLCIINDDIEVLHPDWLAEMVGRLADPGVGAVGARLLFADGSLQHVGHHYGGGDAGHPLFGWSPSTLALGAAAQVAGERVGVTAACVLVRAEDFLAVGGFSEAFPLNYNDVDLCLKLREAGFRLIYTPHAQLLHFESQTRVAKVLASELRQVRTRWTTRMRRDPYLRLSRPPRLRSKFQQTPQHRPPPPAIATIDNDLTAAAASDPTVVGATLAGHKETHV